MAQASVHQVDVQRDLEAADLDQTSEPKNKCLESDALAIACFMFVLVSIAVSVLVSMCCLVPLQVVCSSVFVFLCVLQVVCCLLCGLVCVWSVCVLVWSYI